MIKNDILEVAKTATNTARNIINKYYRDTSSTTFSKADNTLVTLADQQAEKAIRQIIQKSFPYHGIIGEEEASVNLNSDYIWIIDPIDGTDSFILGRPLFCILLGIFYKGQPILSIIDQPFTKERWSAYNNKCLHNTNTITTSNRKSLKESKIILSSPCFFGNKTNFINNIKKQAKIVAWEAESYAFGQLAMGCIDAVIKPRLDTYDYLPVIKLIENAGGAIAAANGDKLTMDYTGDIIAAASQELLNKLINIYNYGATS